MSPKVHIPCGIISGAFAFFITKSLSLSVSCCCANFIFDCDHILEYSFYCVKNKIKPSINDFFSGEYFSKKGTLGVIFHGYEYVLLMILLFCILSLLSHSVNMLILGILIGYSEHLILDLIGNDCSFRGYSLIYRLSVKFKIELICDRNW